MPTHPPLNAETWTRYYAAKYRPASEVDRVRHALLTGATLDPSPVRTESQRIGAVSRQLERLGYVVEREAVPSGRNGRDMVRVRVVNLDHRPTAEDFARRSGGAPSTNGHAPHAPGRGRRGRAAGPAAAMLPRIGAEMTVSVVGFSPDGAPFLVLTSDDGWRYSVAIEDVDRVRR